jgi:predicted DNA-binding ribbon-helix-helix protein
MTSPVVKRSVVIAGHKTSVSLEDAFWNGLKEIAQARHQMLSELLVEIDSCRSGNFSSAIRTFVFDYFRARIPASSERGLEAGMPDAACDRPPSLPGALEPVCP